MSKQYARVSDMLADLPVEDSLRNEVTRQVHKRQIIKHLIALRASRDLSQKDMADRLGCSQSRISKLENGEDDDIKLGDFKDYLRAMGFDLSLLIAKHEWQAFAQIKFHARMIRGCLGQLVELAGDDPAIQEGVSKAHVETLLNLVKFVVDSAQALPQFSSLLPEIIEADGCDEANSSDSKNDSSPTLTAS